MNRLLRWGVPALAALLAAVAPFAGMSVIGASANAPSAAPSQVSEREPDRDVDAPGTAFGVVARLNVQGSGHCSAALIEPTLALTAAHCLRHPKSGRLVSADRLHLLFGYEKGRWLAHRRASAYRVAPERDGARDLSSDWAVIRFDTPVTGMTPLALSGRTPEASPRPAYKAAGYGVPRREILTVRHDCAVLEVNGAVLRLSCVLAKGASGGPVVDRAGRLVGVMVAGAGGPTRRFGLAASIDAERVRAAAVSLTAGDATSAGR